jgi:adenosylcobinamide-GDP ribazoletransferase
MRAALATLTRLPVRSVEGTGVAAFGIVGAIVGLAAVPSLIVLDGSLAPLGAILAVAAMAVITGALHLDGLADTADALMAPDPAHAERARKDPRLGVAGGIALVTVLGLDVAALALLSSAGGGFVAGLVCVVGGACSRVVAVAIPWAWCDRASDGWGGAFARGVGLPGLAVGGLTAATLVVLAAVAIGPLVAVGVLAGSGVGAGAAVWVIRARRQLDGDGLGAAVELTMTAVLVAAAVAAIRFG